MDLINHYHYSIAALIARVFLGCLFFFQGYDAVFNIRIKNVVNTYENDFARHGIPKFLTISASWFNSLTALSGGALLILGLFKYAALYLLGANVIVAATGFGINTPMWDTRHVFPRLILILIVLVLPQSWDIISIDHLFFKQ